MKNKKYIFYLAVAVVSLVVGVLYTPSDQQGANVDFLESTMLSIMNNTFASVSTLDIEMGVDEVDLEIDRIALRKIAEPDEKFNYYKYEASIFVRNVGESFQNINVIASSDSDRNFQFVKNNDNGLSLDSGEVYVMRNYELLFDARYNGGEVEFSLKVDDENAYETLLENNTSIAEVNEYDAKLQNIQVDEIGKSGEFNLSYNTNEYGFGETELYVMFSDQLTVPSENYKEVYSKKGIYNYSVVPNGATVMASGNWKELLSEDDIPVLQVYDDPFEAEKEFYVYLKSVNTRTGFYKVSDVLKFPVAREMNRAEFAKLFVDFAGVNIAENIVTHYQDVDMQSWYGPYVGTLYSLGLTEMNSFKFKPAEKVSRAEVLMTLFDYYDVDLIYLKTKGDRFVDINEETNLYPYAQALKALNMDEGLSENFASRQIATMDFLNYLIYAYTDNN